jgi:hypothetical protein
MNGALAANTVADFRDAGADDVFAPRTNEGRQDCLGFAPLFHHGVTHGLVSLAKKRGISQLDLRLMSAGAVEIGIAKSLKFGLRDLDQLAVAVSRGESGQSHTTH